MNAIVPNDFYSYINAMIKSSNIGFGSANIAGQEGEEAEVETGQSVITAKYY